MMITGRRIIPKSRRMIIVKRQMITSRWSSFCPCNVLWWLLDGYYEQMDDNSVQTDKYWMQP